MNYSVMAVRLKKVNKKENVGLKKEMITYNFFEYIALFF